jgi:hypothetical protein
MGEGKDGGERSAICTPTFVHLPQGGGRLLEVGGCSLRNLEHMLYAVAQRKGARK